MRGATRSRRILALLAALGALLVALAFQLARGLEAARVEPLGAARVEIGPGRAPELGPGGGESPPSEPDVPTSRRETTAPEEVEPRRVAGRVLHSDGSSPGAGLLVLAWPVASAAPTPAQVAFALERDRTALETLCATRTSADGSFVLEGIGWSERSWLEAGGRGLLTPQAQLAEPGETAPVELRVRRGYAAVVELVDPTGFPVVRAGGQAAATRLTAPIPGWTGWLGATPATVAAGLEPDSAEERADRLVALIATDAREHALSPVQLWLHPLGYESVEASFDVVALELATPRERVVLTRTAAGFGALHLRFVNPPTVLAGVPPERYAGGVLQFGRAGGAPMERFSVAPDATWGATLADLPYGEWAVRFRRSSFLDPPESEAEALVTIGREPALHVVDLSGLSVLWIELAQADGASWSDVLSARLFAGRVREHGGGRFSSSGVRTVDFAEPPYFYTGLPPTEHMLQVLSPRARSEASGMNTERFVVEPGAVKRLRFRLEPE